MQTSPQTEIGVDIPLERTPPRDKTVGFVMCGAVACETFLPAFESATRALGWRLRVFPYRPGDIGTGVQSAINAGVDYIALPGDPVAGWRNQLAAANERGIGAYSFSGVEDADPERGLMVQAGGKDRFEDQGAQMGAWAAANLDQPVRAVYVTIKDLENLSLIFPPFQQALEEGCDGCGAEELGVSFEDVASGQIPSKVIAHLQTNPETNLVAFAYPDLMVGFSQALRAANLADRVSVVSMALGASPFVIPGLRDGTIRAVATQPTQYLPWLVVDAMARTSVGMDVRQSATPRRAPTWIAAGEEGAGDITEEYGWPGPEGFEDRLKELWRVSG